jgi:hypothetical protein
MPNQHNTVTACGQFHIMPNQHNTVTACGQFHIMPQSAQHRYVFLFVTLTPCPDGGHSTQPDFSAFGIFPVAKLEGQRMYDMSFQHSMLRTEDLATSLNTRRNVCNILCASWSAGVPMEVT